MFVDSMTSNAELLRHHMHEFYLAISIEVTGDDTLWQAKMGIPDHFMNAAYGPSDINKTVTYFDGLPFVWYVEEYSPWQRVLTGHGFHDLGTFRGVMAELNPGPVGECKIELVTTKEQMDEWTDIVCETFAINSEARQGFQERMRKEKRTFHWIGRKEGRAVAALTSFIDGELVSFWYGASLPEVRGQGFMTALGDAASWHALEQGAKLGISYLTSEAMALGICEKRGAQTVWQFRVFSSP